MKEKIEYNEPSYDKKGNPTCEECGGSYEFLLQHVRLAHGISGKDYKEEHGYHPRKSIIGKEMKQIKKDAIYMDYQRNAQQLAEARKNTMFKFGNKMQSIKRKAIKPKISLTDMIKKLSESGTKKPINA